MKKYMFVLSVGMLLGMTMCSSPESPTLPGLTGEQRIDLITHGALSDSEGNEYELFLIPGYVPPFSRFPARMAYGWRVLCGDETPSPSAYSYLWRPPVPLGVWLGAIICPIPQCIVNTFVVPGLAFTADAPAPERTDGYFVTLTSGPALERQKRDEQILLRQILAERAEVQREFEATDCARQHVNNAKLQTLSVLFGKLCRIIAMLS